MQAGSICGSHGVTLILCAIVWRLEVRLCAECWCDLCVALQGVELDKVLLGHLKEISRFFNDSTAMDQFQVL